MVEFRCIYHDSSKVEVRLCPPYAPRNCGAETVTCAESTALSPPPPPEPGVMTETRRLEAGEDVGGWRGQSAPGRTTTPGSDLT
ncbi:unnamed protein product [Schistocephalus solidus]|uniref:Uncharacterized protein n=1 Tax=Schistocephalus solidus TaxID=70667 RepID=A0A183SER6_SCHSO|nr:unnamed protein product [Schistocephalus solidus]